MAKKEVTTNGGLHKWTIEEKPGYYVFTLYELTADRWIMLGPPEVWSAAAALELLEELETA